MGGLLVEQGDWVGQQPALAVLNATPHPSTASVPVTVLLYSGLLLCAFNMAIEGLNRCDLSILIGLLAVLTAVTYLL